MEEVEIVAAPNQRTRARLSNRAARSASRLERTMENALMRSATPPTSPAQAVARRLLAPALVCGAALTAGAILRPTRMGPQPVLDLPTHGSLLSVHNGTALIYEWSELHERSIEVKAQPVAGGPSRVILHERAEHSTEADPGPPVAARPYLLYLSELGSASTGSAPHLHAILRTLRRQPLAGGPPVDIRAGVSTGFVTAAGFCYWVEKRSGPAPSSPELRIGTAAGMGKRPAILRPSACRLLSCPISGGAVRVIARIPQDSRLYPGNKGIYWTLGSANSSARQDLAYASADGNCERLIPDYTGNTGPLELRNRLYWIEDRPEGQPPDPNPDGGDSQTVTVKSSGVSAPPPHPSPRQRIISVLPDGSQRIVVLDQSGKEKDRLLVGLGEHSGKLYFWSVPRASSGNDQQNTPVLCRIAPETRGSYTRVAPLPRAEGPGCFDGSYFYYAATENRENWWDWSSSGLTTRVVSRVFRLRLTP